jgi:hypothetical protein
MRKLLWIVFAGVALIGLFLFGHYWASTQPILVTTNRKVSELTLRDVPPKNKEIIAFIEENGARLAPTYAEAVCTEFVIKVVNEFGPLSKKEKNGIRIITSDRLDSLVLHEAPIIKGIQSALIQGDKGVEISTQEVMPGDFVQFWNGYQGGLWGHCGVVMEIIPNESLTVYSSHPMTNGYGKQKFLWPDKVYFVRLK